MSQHTVLTLFGGQLPISIDIHSHDTLRKDDDNGYEQITIKQQVKRMGDTSGCF